MMDNKKKQLEDLQSFFTFEHDDQMELTPEARNHIRGITSKGRMLPHVSLRMKLSLALGVLLLVVLSNMLTVYIYDRMHTASCTVVFVDDNNQVIETQTVPYGSSAVAPKVPHLKVNNSFAYSFKGWSEGYDEVRQNLIIKAEYERYSSGLVFEAIDDPEGRYYQVTGYNGEAADVIIPSFYDGLPVYVINDNAFFCKTGIRFVTFPESLRQIRANAFAYCINLRSIALPDALNIIGDNAFMACQGLEEINISDASRLVSIGDNAFGGCLRLFSVYLPSGLSYMKNNSAFAGCTSLTSIIADPKNKKYKSVDGNLYSKDGSELIQYAIGKTEDTFAIPDHVVRISAYPFKGCSNLQTIHLPDSLLRINPGIFTGCPNISRIMVGENHPFYTTIGGNLYSKNGSELILYARGKTDDSFTIPETVKAIGSMAFADVLNLKQVIITGGVTEIGARAFYGCNNLGDIFFPETLTSISEEAFTGTRWYNSQGDGLLYISNVLYEYKGLLPDDARIEIRAGTVSISPYAFDYLDGLSQILITEGVTAIGQHAFDNCLNLKEIVIPASLSELGESAFAYCRSLQKVTFKAGCALKAIREYTFYGCAGLSHINLPQNVTRIDDFALYDQTSVILPASLASLSEHALSDRLSIIFYRGSEEEWALLEQNNDLESFYNVYCNYHD